MYLYVFFFQAEDGIRDHCVTGVQTCALPISRERAPAPDGRCAARLSGDPRDVQRTDRLVLELFPEERQLRRWIERSEERRVGKESRYRRAARQVQKEIRISTV